MFDFSPLHKTLRTLAKLSKVDMEKRFAEAKIGITPLQYGVLAIIRSKPGIIHDIAWRINCKAPSLIPVVDALEQAKLLERKIDAVDRRKTQLVITKKGLDLLAKVPLDYKNDALSVAFRKMSLAKQKQLLSLLQELTENFPS